MKPFYLVFDTETTGLDPVKHEPIQLAFLVLDGEFNPVCEPLQIRIRAERDPDARAMDVNKLDPTVGLTRFDAWHQIQEYVRSAYEQYSLPPEYQLMLMGHNVKFDLDMVYENMPPEFRSWWRKRFGYAFFCTMNLSRTYRMVTGNKGKLRLAEMCKHFDLGEAEFHDATEDVRMTAKLARKLAEQFNMLPRTTGEE